MKPNPQQEKILELHRGGEWVCSTAYEFIRDHRKRISELNLGYLKKKGYVLRAIPCDGRCGKTHSSQLVMRRAEKIASQSPKTAPHTFNKREDMEYAAQLCREFDNL